MQQKYKHLVRVTPTNLDSDNPGRIGLYGAVAQELQYQCQHESLGFFIVKYIFVRGNVTAA